MKVQYTPAALDDLREIVEYIRDSLGSATAAKRYAIQIYDICSALGEDPGAGLPLSERTEEETDLLYQVCGNHIVVYDASRQKNMVSIVRILGTGFEFFRFLFGENFHMS